MPVDTGITRGKRLAVLVGMPKAVAIAVNRADATRRCSALRERLQRRDGNQWDGGDDENGPPQVARPVIRFGCRARLPSASGAEQARLYCSVPVNAF